MDKNMEKYLYEYMKNNIICECGQMIKIKNKELHIKTKKHLDNLPKKDKLIEIIENASKDEIPIKKNKRKIKEDKIIKEDKKIKIPEVIVKKKAGVIKNKVINVTDIDDTKRKDNNDPNKKVSQLRHSMYFITINSNQRYNVLSQEYEEFAKKFKSTIDNLLNNHISEIITLKDNEDDNKKIKSVKSEVALEVGQKTTCVHAHIMMDVAHYSSIKLDYQFIRDYVTKEMGLTNIYLNNKVVFGTTSKLNLKDYIEKSKYY